MFTVVKGGCPRVYNTLLLFFSLVKGHATVNGQLVSPSILSAISIQWLLL
ncbi:MAG TPA: hypothetical protein VK645_10880 [Chitinophagaceae bacterium]|nr:hypothetical protein [Chitinophagaceae bacterium]